MLSFITFKLQLAIMSAPVTNSDFKKKYRAIIAKNGIPPTYLDPKDNVEKFRELYNLFKQYPAEQTRPIWNVIADGLLSALIQRVADPNTCQATISKEETDPFKLEFSAVRAEFPGPVRYLTTEKKAEMYKKMCDLFEKYPNEQIIRSNYWDFTRREYTRALERRIFEMSAEIERYKLAAQNGSCESAPS